jgi:hypothetical protein
MIPWIANHIEMYKQHFPTLPFDCPIRPGNYTANHTYNLDPKAIITLNRTAIVANKSTAGWSIFNGVKMMTLPLPNGIYRNGIHVWTKDDPTGTHVIWQFEMHDRLGSDKF